MYIYLLKMFSVIKLTIIYFSFESESQVKLITVIYSINIIDISINI